MSPTTAGPSPRPRGSKAPPGRYFFELTYTGTIGLAVNGEDRKISPETGSGTITIPFDQPETGATTFTLRLRDTSGPAAIRARVAQ